jgi:hypothetical protein
MPHEVAQTQGWPGLGADRGSLCRTSTTVFPAL